MTSALWALTAQELTLLNVASTTRFLHEIGFLSKRKQTVSQPQNHPQAARYDHIPLGRETVDRLAPANDNLRKALLLTLARHGTASRHAVHPYDFLKFFNAKLLANAPSSK